MSLFTDSRHKWVNEPAHDNPYNKTSVTSKDSDEPVHSPNMERVLVYSPLNNLEAVEGNAIT